VAKTGYLMARKNDLHLPESMASLGETNGSLQSNALPSFFISLSYDRFSSQNGFYYFNYLHQVM